MMMNQDVVALLPQDLLQWYGNNMINKVVCTGQIKCTVKDNLDTPKEILPKKQKNKNKTCAHLVLSFNKKHVFE